MKLIDGGNEPATKEDIRNLQITVIASSIASSFLTIQEVKETVASDHEYAHFARVMRDLIAEMASAISSDSPT